MDAWAAESSESRTTTSWPSDTRSSTTWLPMNPSPPVTRILIVGLPPASPWRAQGGDEQDRGDRLQDEPTPRVHDLTSNERSPGEQDERHERLPDALGLAERESAHV